MNTEETFECCYCGLKTIRKNLEASDGCHVLSVRYGCNCGNLVFMDFPLDVPFIVEQKEMQE